MERNVNENENLTLQHTSNVLLSFDNTLSGNLLSAESSNKLDLVFEDLEFDFTISACCKRWGEKLIYCFLDLLKRKGYPIYKPWFVKLSQSREIKLRYKPITTGRENQIRVDFKYMAAKIGKKGLIPTMDLRKPSMLSKEYWGFLEDGSEGQIEPNISEHIKNTIEWKRFLNRVTMKAKNKYKTCNAYNQAKKIMCLPNNIKLVEESIKNSEDKIKKSYISSNNISEKERNQLMSKKTNKQKKLIRLLDLSKTKLGENFDCLKGNPVPVKDATEIKAIPEYKTECSKYKEVLLKEVKKPFLEKARRNLLFSFKSLVGSKRSELRKEESERISDKKTKEDKSAAVLKFDPKRGNRKRVIVIDDNRDKEVILSNKFAVLDESEEKINSVLGIIEGEISDALTQIDFDYMGKVYDFALNGRRKFSKRQVNSRKAALYHSSGYYHKNYGSVEKFVKTDSKVKVVFDLKIAEAALEKVLAPCNIIPAVKYRGKIIGERGKTPDKRSDELKKIYQNLNWAYNQVLRDVRLQAELPDERPLKKLKETNVEESEIPYPDVRNRITVYKEEFVKELTNFMPKSTNPAFEKFLTANNVKDHIKLLKETYKKELDSDVERELYKINLRTNGVGFKRTDLEKDYALKMIRFIKNLPANSLKGRLIIQAATGVANFVSMKPKDFYDYLKD